MNLLTNYNRLADEKSLYLNQHKKNPIHWWPYTPEAILKAKDENKPLFISIGYSSCHWCHVMAHESFEDLDTANYLNDNFVAIKIDREEFPDIDNYYQKAAPLFGRNGGWPLSVFSLHDLSPYFIGTYFPKNSSEKNGIGFLELLKELKRAYDENKDQVLENAIRAKRSATSPILIDDPIELGGRFPNPNTVINAVKEMFDLENGGIKGAPKFPQFPFYEWAIEQMLEGMIEKENGQFILSSIEKILLGGINDHIRGGIHRYSTDEFWLVPHFEKMLYDQAGLLKLLAKTSLISPTPLVFDTILNTLDYLENEMLSENGHFFSAQDADSEGIEGLFFTFSESEFEDAINRHDDEEETLQKKMSLLKTWFQITEKGNFNQNLNVISLNPKYKEDYYTTENWPLIRKARRALLKERQLRMPPATDNKGIASWNFQLLTALTDIIQYSPIDIIKQKASNLLNNNLDKMFQSFLVNAGEGMRLSHVTTMAHSHPFLEDFVTFSETQLRMYEISGNSVFKQNFSDTLNFITREFLDSESGSLFTRAQFTNENELYPNIEYGIFDSTFKSISATYIILMKRAAVLFSDRDYLDKIENLCEKVAQTILKYNPVAGGEALRALTYPNEAYRVVKVPQNWAQKAEFINFIPYFLPRFVIDYTEEENRWEICNINNCELVGLGFEEFKITLTPGQNAQE